MSNDFTLTKLSEHTERIVHLERNAENTVRNTGQMFQEIKQEFDALKAEVAALKQAGGTD